MNREFILHRASRRDILRAATFFAGGSALAGLMPKVLRSASVDVAAFTANAETRRQQLAAIPLKTEKLRDNLYLLSGPGGNMLVLDGPDGKVLVDSSIGRIAPKIKQIMDGVSNAPFKMLINTHWHFDHTDGNAAMREMGAMILAHENTRKRLSTPQVVEFLKYAFPASPADAIPQETFADSFKVYFNGEEIDLTHVAPAHTDSDIHVHYTKNNVLHMGDTWFSGMFPFFDTSSRGRIDGMIAAATKGIALADSSTKIVPGHGPAGDKTSLTKYRDMLVTVRDRVKKQKLDGKKLEEVIAAKPSDEYNAEQGHGLLTPEQFITLVYTTL